MFPKGKLLFCSGWRTNILGGISMVQAVATQKNLRKVKGRILRDFSCSVTYEDFLKSTKYKNVKTLAFILALVSMFFGLLLPLFVGVVTSLKDYGTELFQINVISNSIMAIVFCLPLSLVFIIGAVPLYNSIISSTLRYYGYTVTPKTLRKEIA